LIADPVPPSAVIDQASIRVVGMSARTRPSAVNGRSGMVVLPCGFE
jgi:hypothetical protein